MKKPLLLAAVLLAGTASVGAAFAASDLLEHRFDRDGRAHGDTASAMRSDDGAFRVADREHHREHDRDGHHGRRHHDDDDDDHDGGEGGRGGRLPVTGPSDPSTPVPDNGLYQGKARPKVEVN